MSHVYALQTEQFLPVPIDSVFEFFSRPENLQSITPPWLDFRIVESPRDVQVGSLIRYSLRWRLIPVHWLTEITAWDPPHRFVDKQISGPYTLWEHEHKFIAEKGGTRIYDTVRYSLPFAALGRFSHFVWIAADLKKIFDFRRAKIEELFAVTP